MDKITTSNRLVGTMEEKQKILDDTHCPLRFSNMPSPHLIPSNTFLLIDASVQLDVFIRTCLIEYFDTYCTIPCDSDTASIDKEVTPPGHHRSLIDIYRICKHYYPSCTLREVRDALISQKGLVGHICREIDRRVLRINTGRRSDWSLFQYDQKDEFDLDLCDIEIKSVK